MIVVMADFSYNVNAGPIFIGQCGNFAYIWHNVKTGSMFEKQREKKCDFFFIFPLAHYSGYML